MNELNGDMVEVNGIEVPNDILLADGLEGGLIGYTTPMNSPALAVYSYNKCVTALMEANDWDHEDATEWMDYNVTSSYVGLGTPIFVYD
jgi:hypothetical protein